jgi:endonuclease III
MTRAITVRLDDADHAALERRAEQLQVRPGTLARILVHAGLSQNTTDTGTSQALTALDRLAKRSQKHAPSDAVALVAEARVGLDTRR